ncbi:lactosylceramide alpha-2,3-sialyltransferase isoform X1 [Phyllopteryx taeniolatus]|uniref:lactosylceramide alpha-2,3-sialyltransferase isoform X1 n=2 Tax=Phyllopteryx taeniolatus TaxID=161469 RepID=UPI002AD41F04|nr:lactosylceramide alpha-2,3-sialyltransferase isoform X1 [Phyllopteryx taeniolatus]
MSRTRSLLHQRKQRSSYYAVNAGNMRLPKRWVAHRRAFLLGGVFCVLCLVIVSSRSGKESLKPLDWHLNPDYKKLVHQHVHKILERECQRGSTRQGLLARLPASSYLTRPFLWKNTPLTTNLFEYPPPFGFRGLKGRVPALLDQLPEATEEPLFKKGPNTCQRCVVIGNGGILKGLELGPFIDRFDTIIRLNSGPLGEFSVDVGTRTSIRMSYPEGTPSPWLDRDPETMFVAVVYKGVDVSWISAMMNKLAVPLWDWLFFWHDVPEEIPLERNRLRLLNPLVIKETALDLLKFSPPTTRLWGWDQNVPTLGVSALDLASLLCDEVSLAGFGYNLSQERTPLHYYDELSMSAMLWQKMHNVNEETQVLKSLIIEGTITDLTGGVHCSFCP